MTLIRPFPNVRGSFFRKIQLPVNVRDFSNFQCWIHRDENRYCLELQNTRHHLSHRRTKKLRDRAFTMLLNVPISRLRGDRATPRAVPLAVEDRKKDFIE